MKTTQTIEKKITFPNLEIGITQKNILKNFNYYSFEERV